MHDITRFFIIAGTTALIGCGSGVDTADSIEDLETADVTPVATVLVTATMRSFEAGIPIAGLEMCELDANPANCTTTDEQGTFTLEFPENSRVGLTSSNAEYQDALFVFETTREHRIFDSLTVAFARTIDILLEQIDQTWDRSLGAIAIGIDSDGLTPTVAPESGEDPFYIEGATISTSTTGSPGPGFMGRVNVEPGEAVFEPTHDSKTCTYEAWSTGLGSEGTQAIELRPGMLTSLFSATCD